MNIQEFAGILNEIAPFHLKEKWDNIGGQVSFPEKTIKHALLALDLTTQILDEAINKKAEAIIVHHPIIFQPLKSLNWNQPKDRILMKAIQNEISIFALHTNYDSANPGLNDFFLSKLDVQNIQALTQKSSELIKLVIYTPKEHTQEIAHAVCNAGAGIIDQNSKYSNCTFSTKGIGTFKGNHLSKPFIGKSDEMIEVNENRLETIVPKKKLSKVLEAMVKAHPYEEIAYDLIKLENKSWGLGRTAELKKPLSPKQLVELISKRIQSPNIRYSKGRAKLIKKIGIITGGAGSYLHTAINAKCDAYISGDIKHNEWHEANESKILLIDAGHYGTEFIFSEAIKKQLKSYQLPIKFTRAKQDVIPFKTHS